MLRSRFGQLLEQLGEHLTVEHVVGPRLAVVDGLDALQPVEAHRRIHGACLEALEHLLAAEVEALRQLGDGRRVAQVGGHLVDRAIDLDPSSLAPRGTWTDHV